MSTFASELEVTEVVLDPTISVDDLVKASNFTNYEKRFVVPQYVPGSLAHVEIPKERRTVNMVVYTMPHFHSQLLKKDLKEFGKGFRLATAFEILSYLATNPEFGTNCGIPAFRNSLNKCDFEIVVGWCGNDFTGVGQDFTSIDAKRRMFHNERHGGATIFLVKE